jgi:hypothetical protein
MDPMVHHLDQAIDQPTESTTCPIKPHTSRLTPRAPGQRAPNRAGQPHVPLSHMIHPFFVSLGPFFMSLSHFAKVSAIFWFCLVILLQCQPFYYSEHNHFAIVNSIIFIPVLSHFLIATMLSHSAVSLWYSAQSFLMLQCSTIYSLL